MSETELERIAEAVEVIAAILSKMLEGKQRLALKKMFKTPEDQRKYWKEKQAAHRKNKEELKKYEE